MPADVSKPGSVPAATVTKSAAERYDVRVRRGSWTEWAIITLSESGGIFNVLSDFGDWNYAWSHHGRPSLKHFLIGLDRDGEHDYLLRKLCGGKKQYNHQRTVHEAKRTIGTMLREGSRVYRGRQRVAFTPALAKLAVRALDKIAEEYTSADLFCHAIMGHEDTAFFYEDFSDGFCEYDYHRGCVNFVERLYPVFVAELRKELNL